MGEKVIKLVQHQNTGIKAGCFLSFAGIAILMTFYFGNPQWNRWIYIFQAYIYHGTGFITKAVAPEKYTGVWREWYANGQIRAERNVINAVREGRSTCWHKNGVMAKQGTFRRGKAVGRHMGWDKNGKVIFERFYLNGTQVTRQQYLAACTKDPTLPKPSDEYMKESDPNILHSTPKPDFSQQ